MGGLLIWKFGIYWLDPLITVLISLYILRETYLLLKDSFNILMQSAPKDIDLEKIKSAIESIEGVKNLHHVHLWSLNDKQVHFEGHVDLEKDMPVSQASDLNSRIRHVLHDRFEIEHSTLQMEFGCCEENKLINET